MSYKMPKNMIVNEEVTVPYRAVYMLFHITNLEEFEEGRDMVFYSPDFKEWLKIADNVTIKKYLNLLIKLNYVESYSFDMRGNLTIRKIRVGEDFIELNSSNLKELSGRALQLVFYMKYYNDVQVQFPDKYYYDYVMTANIAAALGCGNETLAKTMNEVKRYLDLKPLLNTEQFNRSKDYKERISLVRKTDKNKHKILTESDLEKYLINNLHKIEPYLSFVDNQYQVEYGIIDILALDGEGNDCVIEVKITDSDKRLPYQCAYYPKAIGEGTRMIVVAPDYREDILIAMNHLDVELFIYKKVDDNYEIIKYEV